nr:immunoglobulin heavy chain junction region [Macaca mulatta]MOY21077.1 immunoglobulin heavy chain junction region [Macaca mulatta]MOY21748.1 immunoglobulin heavy chain junction region [Macaca mulatta]MOY22021.1 immunoglobulin heavy chain junction region [Macaca mulatta]MOY22039.1 immunoglobulin heavy chain junction region [Macaca mulatta]
CARKEDSLDFW